MGSSLINEQNNHGETTVEADLDCISFSSSEEEEEEEINSSVSFHDMSSLLQHLPFKRGLSRHYQGKAQSFTSLSSVKCIEDLAKPENPYKKKLKSCKSYGGLLLVSGDDDQRNNRSHPSPHKASSSSSSSSSSSRVSCSSLVSANKITSGRPPVPHPHRSSSTSSFSNGGIRWHW